MRVPPSVTFSNCMPRQMPSSGKCASSAAAMSCCSHSSRSVRGALVRSCGLWPYRAGSTSAPPVMMSPSRAASTERAMCAVTGCGGSRIAMPPQSVTPSRYTFGRNEAGTSQTPVCVCSREVVTPISGAVGVPGTGVVVAPGAGVVTSGIESSRSESFKATHPLPVCDRRPERGQLYAGVLEVVVDNFVAECLAGNDCFLEQVGVFGQSPRDPRHTALVGVTCEGIFEFKLMVDTVQTRGDHGRDGEVLVDVTTAYSGFHAHSVPVADNTAGAGAGVQSPGKGRGCKRAGHVAFVGVDVGSLEERELSHEGELASKKLSKEGGHPVRSIPVSENGTAIGATQADVDVATVSPPLVKFCHEGERCTVLVSDLFRTIFVHRVIVAGGECLGVAG